MGKKFFLLGRLLIDLLHFRIESDATEFFKVFKGLEALDESRYALSDQWQSVVLGVAFHQFFNHLEAQIYRRKRVCPQICVDKLSERVRLYEVVQQLLIEEQNQLVYRLQGLNSDTLGEIVLMHVEDLGEKFLSRVEYHLLILGLLKELPPLSL